MVLFSIVPAQFWVNLYLYDYESDYISNLIKSDKSRAFKFMNISRFTCDEYNLNDSSDLCFFVQSILMNYN